MALGVALLFWAVRGPVGYTGGYKPSIGQSADGSELVLDPGPGRIVSVLSKLALGAAKLDVEQAILDTNTRLDVLTENLTAGVISEVASIKLSVSQVVRTQAAAEIQERREAEASIRQAAEQNQTDYEREKRVVALEDEFRKVNATLARLQRRVDSPCPGGFVSIAPGGGPGVCMEKIPRRSDVGCGGDECDIRGLHMCKV